MNTTKAEEIVKALRLEAERARFAEYREVGIGLDRAADRIEEALMEGGR